MPRMTVEHFFVLLSAGVVLCMLGAVVWRVIGPSIQASRKEGGGKSVKPVVVYVGSSVATGYLKGLLNDAGIPAFIWGEGVKAGFSSPLRPDQQFGRKVVVDSQNLERARPIIEQFEAEGLFPGPTCQDAE